MLALPKHPLQLLQSCRRGLPDPDTAAANQAAENEVFMAAANKVKRQEKEAKMAGEWAALPGPRLSASVL